MHYTDFPEAPASGTVLCEIDDIAGGLHSACLGGFAYLVLDSADGPRAYVNACPHQFLPLDHRGDQVVGADGRLLCTNHNAAFDAQTGEGGGWLRPWQRPCRHSAASRGEAAAGGIARRYLH